MPKKHVKKADRSCPQCKFPMLTKELEGEDYCEILYKCSKCGCFSTDRIISFDPCPKCNMSDQVIEACYGFSSSGLSEDSKTFLTGFCCDSEYAPHRYCKRCKKTF